MPNPVIVPMDGSTASERALIIGGALARHAEAELLVVHAAADAQRAEQRQQELEDELARLGLVGEVMATSGSSPGDLITHLMSLDPAGVICMATHGRGRLGGALVGSTAEELLRRRLGPILLVGPNARVHPEWDWKELAICVDSSPESEASLPRAAEWVDTMSMRLRVLHVLNPATTRELRRNPRLHFRDDSYAHTLALELGSLWDVDADVELLYGSHPAHAIVDYLEANPTVLPFLGTHGRTGIRRAVLGSVTAGVVRDGLSPVVVVCPSTG